MCFSGFNGRAEDLIRNLSASKGAEFFFAHISKKTEQGTDSASIFPPIVRKGDFFERDYDPACIAGGVQGDFTPCVNTVYDCDGCAVVTENKDGSAFDDGAVSKKTGSKMDVSVEDVPNDYVTTSRALTLSLIAPCVVGDTCGLNAKGKIKYAFNMDLTKTLDPTVRFLFTNSLLCAAGHRLICLVLQLLR